jgi:hypothetical protein
MLFQRALRMSFLDWWHWSRKLALGQVYKRLGWLMISGVIAKPWMA